MHMYGACSLDVPSCGHVHIYQYIVTIKISGRALQNNINLIKKLSSSLFNIKWIDWYENKTVL